MRFQLYTRLPHHARLPSGKGVETAVSNIREEIGPRLEGYNATDQIGLDSLMQELDGTDDKSRLGANAILIKPNQIGTLTETIRAMKAAKKSWVEDYRFTSFRRNGGRYDCPLSCRYGFGFHKNRLFIQNRQNRQIQ